MSINTITSFDSKHQDMIHDAQMDYYGKRLATCSSDKTIKIFNIKPKGGQTHVADLVGHEAPVWQICWSHPKFGSKLASCSYDRKVIVWSEEKPNQWVKFYEYSGHELSVNSIAWAPSELGLRLVCGSSDGTVSVLTHAQNDWSKVRFQAHPTGVNAVSWAPSYSPSAVLSNSNSSPVIRLASGGCDKLVKIWQLNVTTGDWCIEQELDGHNDWIRDVAWAPNVGLPYSTIASCSQDGTVILWSQSDENPKWTQHNLPAFNSVVWRVSWSVTGNLLAVSTGDNKVSLWKESTAQEWECISSLEETENKE